MRLMFVSQPPPHEVTIKLNFCNGFGDRQFHPQDMEYYRLKGGSEYERRFLSITSDADVTVGQVLEAASSLRQKHRLRPRADTIYHDRDGYVQVEIEFGATVPIQARSWVRASTEEKMKPGSRASSMLIASMGRAFDQADLLPYIQRKQERKCGHNLTLGEDREA